MGTEVLPSEVAGASNRHQNVDIAAFGGLIAGIGAEESKTDNAETLGQGALVFT